MVKVPNRAGAIARKATARPSRMWVRQRIRRPLVLFFLDLLLDAAAAQRLPDQHGMSAPNTSTSLNALLQNAA
jgi:hypothetical protein